MWLSKTPRVHDRCVFLSLVQHQVEPHTPCMDMHASCLRWWYVRFVDDVCVRNTTSTCMYLYFTIGVLYLYEYRFKGHSVCDMYGVTRTCQNGEGVA